MTAADWSYWPKKFIFQFSQSKNEMEFFMTESEWQEVKNLFSYENLRAKKILKMDNGPLMEAEMHLAIVRMLLEGAGKYRVISRFGCGSSAVVARRRWIAAMGLECAKAEPERLGRSHHHPGRSEWRCPQHGRVIQWPCVACAAEEAARKRRDGYHHPG